MCMFCAQCFCSQRRLVAISSHTYISIGPNVFWILCFSSRGDGKLVGGMVVSWFVGVSATESKYRLLLVACILSGLIQKPLISYAADVRVMIDVLGYCQGIGFHGGGLGLVALLCRQIFARCAQFPRDSYVYVCTYIYIYIHINVL